MSNNKYLIQQINQMGDDECFAALARLFNTHLCDPVLRKSIASRPYQDFIHLRNSLYSLLDELSFKNILEILRANDVLGASPKELTGDALNEQTRSGLQSLSAYDRSRLTTLNNAYKAKFSFNFICVTKNLSKEEIFFRFEKRISNDFESEFLFSIIQLKKLLHIRLSEIISKEDLPGEPSFFMDNLNQYVEINSIIQNQS